MIPLSELRKAHKKREDEQTAVACDSADDEICTAEDPSKCRVHGIRRYERESDYLDKLAHASEESEEARKKFNYFRDLANSMTMEDVEKEIASAFHSCAGSIEELKKIELSDENKLLVNQVVDSYADETDAKTVVATKRIIAATIQHLRDKFGIKGFNKDVILLLMKPRRKEAGGGTFQMPNGTSLCVVFSALPIVKNDLSFCHGDYRDNFDYFRHEIGHVLAMSNGIKDGAFSKMLGDGIAEDELNKALSGVSRYAMMKKDEGEAEAECFSCYTSNDYDNRLPSVIEQFIAERMIGE